MEKIMNLEEMRTKLQEIVAKLGEYDSLENYDETITNEINALHDEFSTLKGNIEAKEKLENMKAASTVSARKVAPSKPSISVQPSKADETMGFKNLGDFAKAVADKSKGRVDHRFNNSSAFEKFAEDGGVLVPSEFINEIQTKVQGDQSLLAKTTQYTISGNHLSLPVDEEEPWNGGVKAYWVAEGNKINESKPALKEVNYRLHKLGAMISATDELLEDAVAMESLIRSKAPDAIVHKLNDALVNGDGAGKPKGLLNSGFKYEVAKESGQLVDTVVYENLIKMEARMLPGRKYMWLANPAVREQLLQLKDANGNHIYMNGAAFPNMSATPFEVLLGKEIMYMGGAMPALGDVGDIVLVDMATYYSVVKSAGIKQAMSTHLYFDREKTAFRFTFRVDGSCPFTKPVTTQYGNYEMAGIITLAAR